MLSSDLSRLEKMDEVERMRMLKEEEEREGKKERRKERGSCKCLLSTGNGTLDTKAKKWI